MPRGTLPGRAENMFAVIPVSLEAQFGSAQRGLRLRAAHGEGTQPSTDFTASLGLRGSSSWSGIRETLSDPTERIPMGSSPGSWMVRGTSQTLTSRAPRGAPVANPKFLWRCVLDTVLLEPRVLEGFHIDLLLCLEGPSKFRQHRPVPLKIDGLRVAADVSRK